SDNLGQVERICSRVILLGHGIVINDGHPTDVCNSFVDRSNQKIHGNKRIDRDKVRTSGEVKSSAIDVIDETGSSTDSIEFLRPMRVRLAFNARVPLQRI